MCTWCIPLQIPVIHTAYRWNCGNSYGNNYIPYENIVFAVSITFQCCFGYSKLLQCSFNTQCSPYVHTVKSMYILLHHRTYTLQLQNFMQRTISIGPKLAHRANFTAYLMCHTVKSFTDRNFQVTKKVKRYGEVTKRYREAHKRYQEVFIRYPWNLHRIHIQSCGIQAAFMCSINFHE